jgi:hypothetical protein
MDLLLGALVLVLGFVVSAVILTNAFKEESNAIDEVCNKIKEGTVPHLEGYTVEAVEKVRDENGNWKVVYVNYRKEEDILAEMLKKMK